MKSQQTALASILRTLIQVSRNEDSQAGREASCWHLPCGTTVLLSVCLALAMGSLVRCCFAWSSIPMDEVSCMPPCWGLSLDCVVGRLNISEAMVTRSALLNWRFEIKCTFHLFPPPTPFNNKGSTDPLTQGQSCLCFNPKLLQSSFMLLAWVKAGRTHITWMWLQQHS